MSERVSSMQTLRRWITCGVAVVVLAALAIYWQGEPEREVRSMPAAERRALYQRTLETLQNTCARAQGPTVREHCREQATFIELFPECNNPCRDLVVQLTSPRR
jgi:hypothetical protein